MSGLAHGKEYGGTQEAIEYARASKKLSERIRLAIKEIIKGSKVSFNCDITVRYNEVSDEDIVAVRMATRVG